MPPIIEELESPVKKIGENSYQVKFGGISVTQIIIHNLDLSAIQFGDSPDDKYLGVDSSGLVSLNGKNGYDCKLAQQVQEAVANVLKDGKLNQIEFNRLGQLVANAPDPSGKKEPCAVAQPAR